MYDYFKRSLFCNFQDALNRAGAVLFMENNLRLTTSNLNPIISKALGTGEQKGSGIVGWRTKHAVTSLTHPRMFNYFHTSDESFLFLPMVEATKLLIYNTESIHSDVMLPWIQCALIHDCLLPIGKKHLVLIHLLLFSFIINYIIA